MRKNLVLNGFDKIIPQKQLVPLHVFACAAVRYANAVDAGARPWLLRMGSALREAPVVFLSPGEMRGGRLRTWGNA